MLALLSKIQVLASPSLGVCLKMGTRRLSLREILGSDGEVLARVRSLLSFISTENPRGPSSHPSICCKNSGLWKVGCPQDNSGKLKLAGEGPHVVRKN